MPSLVRGFSDDIKLLQDIDTLYSVKGDLLNDVLQRIGSYLKRPTYLSASSPTPDSLLRISSARLENPDGTMKVKYPEMYKVSITDTTINFQTGECLGGLLVPGFILPPSTLDYARRLVLVLHVGNEFYIDTLFSDEVENVNNLEHPDVLFNQLVLSAEDHPLGWIDLQCSDTDGKYKTYGSSTDVIENGRIFNIYD